MATTVLNGPTTGLPGGAVFTCSIPFLVTFTNTDGSGNDKIYYGPYKTGGLASFTSYSAANIPAPGSRILLSSLAHYGVNQMSRFVAPVNCKLLGMGYSLDLYNPPDDSLKLRMG